MTIWTPIDDGYADLSNHDSFLAGPPENTFKRLRDHEPLSWTAFAGGAGFWNLVRHGDVFSHNRDFRGLTSARGIRMEDQTEEEYLARRTFQETDPPEHTKVRMRVAKAFSKPVIAGFETRIRELCDEILDVALAKPELDAAHEIARQLPMRLLGQIIGVPNEDLDWLVSKGDELIANTDPEYTEHVLDKADTEAFRLMPFRSPAGAELYQYAEDLITSKREAGEDAGVLGMILEPDEDGNVMPKHEFQNFFCLLVAAGNDTTRYSISASLHALANKPELHEQLYAGDDALWETAPDELIRWASPTRYFRRTATRNLTLHGKTIREGDKVLLWFVSGNRDERMFENPYAIDLRRHPNRHVAFGQGGPHVCLGMWLAKLEIRLLLQEFVKRVARVEQNGEHEYLRGNFVGGIKRLPVRVALR